MYYQGSGVGHVGTCVSPAPDEEWMDVDEPGDINSQLISEVVNDKDDKDVAHDGEGEIDEGQEEYLSPEDGEGMMSLKTIMIACSSSPSL